MRVTINQSQYTIAELMEQLERRELVINETYQRSVGVWPLFAKTYFIDTILEGFPFPKIYLYQAFDKDLRKPRREVVDGQQRLKTIEEFIGNRFALSSSSKNFGGLRFLDLGEEKQNEFLMYQVPADVILSADRDALLEMFRRINAYTAPLNSAEKRHSEFQGEFKWLINDLADNYSPFLGQFGVLTEKQIVRMMDAELIAELALVVDLGIVNKSPKSLRDIYKRYNDEFPLRDAFFTKIADFFQTVTSQLSALRGTHMMKPYALHSLFTAMTHLKYGIPNGTELLGVPPQGKYFRDIVSAQMQLLELAEAHEMQDVTGPHAAYVAAASSTTTKTSQRTTRTKAIIRALM